MENVCDDCTRRNRITVFPSEKDSTMTRNVVRFALALAVLATPALARADEDEDAIREAFTSFQKAVKAADPEKMWPLLDTATQKAAERNAKTLRENYAKAGDKEKADLEKSLGLTAEELGKLTGKLYLKSKRFLSQNDEVPGSKISKVEVKGDKATVYYVEADGDKEKMALVRQDGKWKLSIKVN
jgi:hypothetical protein